METAFSTWHVLEDGQFHQLTQVTKTEELTDITSYYVDGKLTKETKQPTSNRQKHINHIIANPNGAYVPICLTPAEIIYIYNAATTNKL